VSKFAWYLPLYPAGADPGGSKASSSIARRLRRLGEGVPHGGLKSLYELQLKTIQAAPRLFCDEDADAGARSGATSHPDLPVLGACDG